MKRGGKINQNARLIKLRMNMKLRTCGEWSVCRGNDEIAEFQKIFNKK